MIDRGHLHSASLEEAMLSLDDLCRVCALSPHWVIERIRAGLLMTVGDDPASWRFDAVALHRVRCIARLERDFDAVPELAALVADLQAEIDDLRRRLLHAGPG